MILSETIKVIVLRVFHIWYSSQNHKHFDCKTGKVKLNKDAKRQNSKKWFAQNIWQKKLADLDDKILWQN